MLVVAEGIETQQQLAFLQDHACPEGQGCYFSLPVAAAELGQLLKRDGTPPRTTEVTV
jgi:EAL domain-containing protein (putative c-di-GMP-specific phosphodiesterase class I)